MAAVDTKAIVINAIKYSDTSLIVKLYTRECGLVSYMLKGVLKSKKGKLKPAYFQPLTQLRIIASHQEKRSLQLIKDAQVEVIYQTIQTDIVKQSIAMFVSEVMSSAIQEEESNHLLYDYLETSFLWLDTHDNISNFHILFLLNLTRFLGFYPEAPDDSKKGFHLREGTFTNQLYDKEVIKDDEFIRFKKLLGTNFDGIESINFSKGQRQNLLRILIRYFELHLGGFKKPKSLDILEAVFSR